MIRNIIFLFPIGLLSSGCAYRPPEVADPHAITLKAAVIDVADSLSAVKQLTRTRQQIGLYPSEATVEFNIASKSTEEDTLKIDASAPSGFLFPISGSAASTLTNEGSRGNKITITFKNIMDSKMSKVDIDLCRKSPRPAWCANIMQHGGSRY